MAYNVSFEDSSPLISYEPTDAWNDTPQDDSATSFYSSSSFHTTATQGASLSFSFNGTGVWLYGARRPDYGAYSVSIDGQLLLEDDANSSSPTFQQLLGFATGLEIGLHKVTLTNTESSLDLDYILFEAFTAQDVTASTIIFDDTDPGISYDFRWTKGDHLGFYNSTNHYTWSPDASFQFMFDGEAIAIYGTVAPLIGEYIVNLDGVEHQLNGGSDGTAQVLHEQTLLFFANNIGAVSHNLVIRANPWGSGDPSFFELDAISVLSTSGNTTPVSDALLQSSTSSPPNPTSTSLFSSDLTPASTTSDHLANKELIAASISAGVICLLAIVFFSLFCLRRHHCDPPLYKDTEVKETKVFTRSPITPGLPIQDVEKYAGLGCEEDHPIAYREFSPYVSYHKSVSSRSTLYEGYSLSSYYEPESNRSTMSSLGPSRHRRNGSNTSVWSGRSSYSSMSNESCRISINGMPMPPQFQVPRKPVPSVCPLRPSRNRETMQIPF